jgi:phage terminase large subunit-like protein
VNESLVELLASLPKWQQDEIIKNLDPAEALSFEYRWEQSWARKNQLPPPGTWRTWLLLAGRGFGKTRTGAEWVRDQVTNHKRRRIALVAPTAGDCRDVMVEGESGLLAIFPPGQRPRYEPSKRRVTFSNGAIATTYSADEPERLRGPQHDAAWCDEIASWRYPEAWDMLMFGLRLGADPRVVVTTTPKPTKIIRELLADPTTAVTRGSTYDNSENLADAFLGQIVRKYEGSRLGRQELLAEVLDDVPGALWTRQVIEDSRWPASRTVPELRRIVVAIDPAASSGEEADETGIIVAGRDGDGRGFVLDDRSGRYAPTEWAHIAISLYRRYDADRVVAEVNNGGDMVEATLRMVDSSVSYTPVHATRGKVVRAEPIAALYEQGRIHHIGAFPTLEDQQCSFTSDADRSVVGYSPDRVDALVWAFTELFVEVSGDRGYVEWLREAASEAKARKAPPAAPTEPNYAVGSVQWEEKQKARREKDLARARAEDEAVLKARGGG